MHNQQKSTKKKKPINWGRYSIIAGVLAFAVIGVQLINMGSAASYPEFSQERINQALYDVSWGNTSAGCFKGQVDYEEQGSKVNASSAMFYLALVANYYPDARGSSGRPGDPTNELVVDRLVKCIRVHTGPSTEIGTHGLFPWTQLKTPAMFLLAKNNPAIWEQRLSDDLKDRMEWMMRTQLVVANFNFNGRHGKNGNGDGAGIVVSLDRGGGYLPNQRIQPQMFTYGWYWWGGKDQLNAVLGDFDWDEYIAKFNQYGWTRIKGQWTKNANTRNLFTGQTTSYDYGPHNVTVTRNGVAEPLDFIKGRAVTNPDKGEYSTGSQLPYTPFNVIKREEGDFAFGNNVVNESVAKESGCNVTGKLQGNPSPLTGKQGMLLEFNTYQGRSELHYSYFGAQASLPHHVTLIALGEWRYGDPEWDALEDKLWVGLEHMFKHAGQQGWRASGGQGRCGKIQDKDSFSSAGWKYNESIYDEVLRSKTPWDRPDGTMPPPNPDPNPDPDPAPINGQPDLVVNKITWTPTGPKPGDQVVFSAEIQNNGDGSTPSGVIHGISWWVNGSQVSWSDNSIEAMAAGEKRILTATSGRDGDNIWIPNANGSYSVEAQVDDVNRIIESNEANQTKTATVLVSDTPNQSGDVNNDGNIDIVDLSIMLSDWGSSNSQSDVNQDGKVDIVDLSILLSNWS